MRRSLWMLTALLLLLAPASARAQSGDPKAHEIFDKMIEALGGDTFLNVKTLVRSGRLYDFDGGNLASSGSQFKNYVKFRDREWMEYGKHGNIVYLNNGEQGWELDRQGITESVPEAVQNWNENNRKDPEYLFRFRVREENLPLYYTGNEFLDNRMVHKIDIVDSDDEEMTLYVDARTYLPLQLRYSRHNELLRQRVPINEYYGKYIVVGGVQVPLHIMRERNGVRVFEVFLKEVSVTEDVPDDFFTLESLEARWKKLN